MAKSDKMIKEAGIVIQKTRDRHRNDCSVNPTELLEFYHNAKPDYHGHSMIGSVDHSRYSGCAIIDLNGHHRCIFKDINNTYWYWWAGNGYLTSTKMLSLEFLEELNTVKKSELEASKVKRSNKVKTPTDAVRVIVRDEIGLSNTDHQLVLGKPRIRCDWFHLSIEANDTTADVEVRVLYKSVPEANPYIRIDKIATINLADPNFSSKLQTIVCNFRSAKQILMGQMERRM